MHKANDLVSSARVRLNKFLRVNGKLASYLTPPKQLAGMSDSARKDLEHKESTVAARKVVDLYLHKNKEFTDAVSALTDLRSQAAVNDCCREVRDVIKEVQANHWSAYVATRRDSNKLVAAK